jgi:hypothetical protein
MWLKQDTFWMANDHQACQDAVALTRIMMRQVQSLWPCETGLEWNLPKMHKQLHVPEDIQQHGNHKNIHTGPQEQNHINIKKAAKKTQQNKKKIDVQTSHYVMEQLVIQQAYDFVKSKQLQIPRQNNGTINLLKATIQLSLDSTSGAGSVGVTIGSAPNIQDRYLFITIISFAY